MPTARNASPPGIHQNQEQVIAAENNSAAVIRETPLPWGKLSVLLAVRLSDPINFSLVLPFIYKMVSEFDVVKSPKDVAFYSGLIMASLSISQTMTVMYWGRLSDRIGRRPVILIGLVGNTATTILFGMSRSFTWALITRSMNGMFIGTSSVVKSVVVEISDDTNRPRMMAMLPLAWNLGAVVGASIGGIFADPVHQYPGLFGSSKIFATFPYLLPSLIGSIVAVFGFIMGTYQLDETLVKETCVVTAPLVPRLSTDSASELTPLVGRDVESTVVEVEQRSIRDLLTPTVLRVMTTNALMCMSVSMSDQLYPIFAATKPSDGGLGFEFRKIGYSLAISGIAVLYVQLIAYPKLALKHGVLFCYQTGMKILVPVFIAIPFLSLLADKVKSTINVAVPDASPLLSLPAISTAWGAVSLDYCLLWALLTFLLLARIAGDVLAFTSINLITANVAPSRADLGFMNGAQQMAMSFTRILGPLVSGTAWSWSIKHSLPFPFNSHFAWMLCALLMAVASYMSHSLPNSVNKFAADNHTRAGNNEISNSNAE